MKENNYITIPGFLRTRLDLKGSELIITALIYGYSQDGNSWFMGKTEYIAEWAGITDKNVLRSLKSLTEKGILEKKEMFVNNKAKRCYYKFNFECAELQNSTVAELQNSTVAELQNSTVAELQNSTVYNNIDNNIYNDNIKPEKNFSGLFPNELKTEESKDKKTLFRNSDIYKLVRFENGVGVDYSEFESKFAAPEFEKVDLVYYFHAVSDWSDQRNMKRTKNGWLATIRNFIRGDVEKKKLHLKPQYQQNKMGIDISAAMEYLNNDY